MSNNYIIVNLYKYKEVGRYKKMKPNCGIQSKLKMAHHGASAYVTARCKVSNPVI